MRLKTYRAESIAEALAAVKKDMGREAVILHTRQIKTGGFLGFKRKQMVEITASDQQPRAGSGQGAGVGERAAASEAGSGIRERKQRAGSLTAGGPASGPATGKALVAGNDPQRAAEPVRASVANHAYRAATGQSERRPVFKGELGTAALGPGLIHEQETLPQERHRAEGPRPEPVVMTVRQRRDVGEGSVQAVQSVEPAGQNENRLMRELSDIKLLVNQVLQTSPSGIAPTTAAGGMSDALFRQYLRLLEAAVSRDIADSIVGAVRDELTPGELADESIVRSTVLRHLAALIPVADQATKLAGGSRGPMVLALVGPTGVGKTTTIAKLAATYKLRQGRSVALITSDTYRIAAVDQLRTYAGILGVPMRVVTSPTEMEAAVASLANFDVVLIDTAGRSQNATERLRELGEFLEAARPVETHLVLSSASSHGVLERTAQAFAAVKPNRLILSKLDEAVNFGVVVNVARSLSAKLSFVTTGQEVPDHIEPGRPERLARMILDNSLTGVESAPRVLREPEMVMAASDERAERAELLGAR